VNGNDLFGSAHVHVQCVKESVWLLLSVRLVCGICYLSVKAKGLLAVSYTVSRNKYAHVKDGKVCRVELRWTLVRTGS
jgi:hypothetical protein